jgi:hypothetical protein
MGLSNETGRVHQRVWRRLQNVRCAQRIFGERSTNVSGSFAKIFAPNLFGFDKRLRSLARFKIFSDALPVDIVPDDFESVLSVNAFANYLQRVRSLAPCSYDTKKASAFTYGRLSGTNKLSQNRDYI